MVINLPPDKNGKLIDGDVKNLMNVAKELGINRIQNTYRNLYKLI